MGDGGTFGGGFSPGDFFAGVISSIVAVINAIIAALVFLFNLLVAVLNFLWGALVAIANFLVSAVKLLVRGFIHVISDIVHGRFLHLFQDYLDLKAKIKAWLDPVLKILQRVRALFRQYVLAPLLRTINMIQKLRQFLAVFRLLGFKWATRLDNYLVKIEQKFIRNTLTIQGWINFAISILNLVIDPTLIFRKNVLLASLLSFVGALKRIVLFGANRPPTAAENQMMGQDVGALSKGSVMVQSGFGKGATYGPTPTRVLAGIDDALAYYDTAAPNV